jgi:hypothetical protein
VLSDFISPRPRAILISAMNRFGSSLFLQSVILSIPGEVLSAGRKKRRVPAVTAIRTLQTWMGHPDIKSTMVYLKGVHSKDALKGHSLCMHPCSGVRLPTEVTQNHCFHFFSARAKRKK